MSDCPQTTPYDCSPEEGLQAVAQHQGPLWVDLDETLYLHNSTADFLSHAWPGPLAFLLVKLVDLVGPWRLTGGAATRDSWRVAAVIVLMPWTLSHWRRRTGSLAARGTNAALAERLRASPLPKAVVTLGFAPIVEPLVAAMKLGSPQLAAMSPWRPRERLAGKRAMAERILGAGEMERALLITDSVDDVDLLAACGRPLRVVWPQARYRPAFFNRHIPGLYLARVKRLESKDLLHNVIGNDFVLWVLASTALAATHLAWHVAGLALLALSFWAIYEWGYADNDLVAAQHEANPVLSQAFHEGHARISYVQPWFWAAACGVAGLWLLRWPVAPVAADVLAWTGLLFATFNFYLVYNRADKQTRLWLYPGLQAARSGAFIAVTPVTLFGALAVAAHTLARWVPYYTYRMSRVEWTKQPVGTLRLVFFVLLAMAVAASTGATGLFTWELGVIVAWFVLRAGKELWQIALQARWIAR